MGAGKTDHTYISVYLSLTHHPWSALRARNRLHSSKIHKTLIMQKCPNLQQELKYQEFLYPVGKKANTSLRVSLFLNSFKMPTTLHLYAWTHICAPPFSMLFPHGKKKPFCNPWGHCCGWTNEIRCFYLITWKGLALSSATHSKDLYSRDQEECFALKNF